MSINRSFIFEPFCSAQKYKICSVKPIFWLQKWHYKLQHLFCGALYNQWKIKKRTVPLSYHFLHLQKHKKFKSKVKLLTSIVATGLNSLAFASSFPVKLKRENTFPNFIYLLGCQHHLFKCICLNKQRGKQIVNCLII